MKKKEILNDIQKTLKIITIGQSSFNETFDLIKGTSSFNTRDYNSLYSFTTEDIKTYYQDLKDTQTHLCVTSSGDHVINAILLGAKKIDTFDTNKLCKYALSLKIAAIKTLSLEEFLEYYENFSYKLYSKIKPALSEEDAFYWDYLYETLCYDDIGIGNIISENLFSYITLKNESLISINPYLEPHNFQKVKELLEYININFINSNLFELENHIKNKKYDVINLSNIYEYWNFGSKVSIKKAKEYYEYVMKYLYPKLNKQGTLVLSYFYSWSDTVNQEFTKLYQEYKTTTFRLLDPREEIEWYKRGLTSQNLAYHQLFELIKNDPIIKSPTNHVLYGKSTDMSHDMALLLKK